MKKTGHPRPQLVRDAWVNLNGQWKFAFDDANVGLKEEWFKDHNYDLNIEVPFVFETELSGINKQEIHEVVWYEKEFDLPKEWNDNVIIHFGAVDYYTKIYVNGKLVGDHTGGHVSFSLDITNFLNKDGSQKVTVYVYDPARNEKIPRGKQAWTDEPHAIWYTRTTGIWQTVWLEHVKSTHIEKVFMDANIELGTLNLKVETTDHINKELKVKVYDEGNLIISDSYLVDKSTKRTLQIWNDKIFDTYLHHAGKSWTPENPFLYDITLELWVDGVMVDEVKSYFGMRKIHQENGMIFLNNRPYYLKLVLDQGYYPKSLLTAPSDEDLIKDIEISKAMGFNGARKHQKIEEERYLYYADKMGFLVWGEMPSSATYDVTYHKQIINEWANVIERDYNHPSIIAWVPLNESWGVPQIQYDLSQQQYAMSLYNLTKSMDQTRLVVSNDGWEQVDTDICAIHNYNHGGILDVSRHIAYEKSLSNKEEILNSYPAGRMIYADGYNHRGEPIMLTEFGGISYIADQSKGWGYTNVTTEEDFLKEYDRILTAINNSDIISGFCYTQLTDVEQEVNGLVGYNREVKVPLEAIKKINDKVGYEIAKKLG